MSTDGKEKAVDITIAYYTPIRPGGQTYFEYSQAMTAHRLEPDSYETWAEWQRYYEQIEPGGALRKLYGYDP